MHSKKIVFISGSGRSGSTLLSILMSHADQIFNLGQLRDFWNSYLHDFNCSCGNKLSVCPVWSVTVNKWMENNGNLSVFDMAKLSNGYFSELSNLSKWPTSEQAKTIFEKHGTYIRQIDQFITFLAEETGRIEFVDSSKSPAMALAFLLSQRSDIRVLNLIRNPLAVAESWKRKDNEQNAISMNRTWKHRQMTLLNWSSVLGSKFASLRYEDFTENPTLHLDKIMKWSSLQSGYTLKDSTNKFKASWGDLHLFPPANENVLAEKSDFFVVKEADSWKSELGSKFQLQITKDLGTFPQNFGY